MKLTVYYNHINCLNRQHCSGWWKLVSASFSLPECLLAPFSESALTEQDLFFLQLQPQVSAKVILVVVEGASLEPQLTISRMRGTRSPIKRVHDVLFTVFILAKLIGTVRLQMMSTASSLQ